MISLAINTDAEAKKVKELILSFFTLNDLEKERLQQVNTKSEIEAFLENPESYLDQDNVQKLSSFINLIELLQEAENESAQ